MILSVTLKMLRFFVAHIQRIKNIFCNNYVLLNPNLQFVSSNYKNQSIFKTRHSTFLLGCSLSISCGCFSAELLLFRNLVTEVRGKG